MNIEDLKCCGNCKYMGFDNDGDVCLFSMMNKRIGMNIDGFVSPDNKCDKWEFDNKTSKQRKDDNSNLGYLNDNRC